MVESWIAELLGDSEGEEISAVNLIPPLRSPDGSKPIRFRLQLVRPNAQRLELRELSAELEGDELERV